ncbi:MAG: lysoplasmalogenase family protein [Bacillota bacterium]|nr:lysoplasmalogenase family protein [Bacillota bacterium]
MKTFSEFFSSSVFKIFGSAALIIPLYFVILGARRPGFSNQTLATLTCAAVLLLFGGLQVLQKGWAVPLALAVSVVGDYFLSTRHGIPNTFIKGIACFFVAHALFTTFFILNGRHGVIRWAALGVGLAGGLIYYFVRLLPHISAAPMRVAVLLYLVISFCSLAFALDLNAPLIPLAIIVLGVMTLLFSDTLIAEQVFAGRAGKLPIIPTYLASHMLITVGTLFSFYFKKI